MSRAYRLQHGEPLPEGIARIARGRIDHALDELCGRSDNDRAEAVHEARKDIKKLRALLRLVRGEIGEQVFRRENTSFRDAARELAGVRDADVMLATLEKLELDAPGLRRALEAHRRRTTSGGSLTIEMLTAARTRVTDWPLESEGFELFEAGLRRTYRDGRRGAEGDPHEWRKRVKDLWYQLLVLREIWPPVMTALADEAHELSDRLGDHNDLTVLLEWGGEHGGVEEIEPAVACRRAELRVEARAYGARLYADKPKAFVGRIERWHGASAHRVIS